MRAHSRADPVGSSREAVQLHWGGGQGPARVLVARWVPGLAWPAAARAPSSMMVTTYRRSWGSATAKDEGSSAAGAERRPCRFGDFAGSSGRGSRGGRARRAGGGGLSWRTPILAHLAQAARCAPVAARPAATTGAARMTAPAREELPRSCQLIDASSRASLWQVGAPPSKMGADRQCALAAVLLPCPPILAFRFLDCCSSGAARRCGARLALGARLAGVSVLFETCNQQAEAAAAAAQPRPCNPAGTPAATPG